MSIDDLFKTQGKEAVRLQIEKSQVYKAVQPKNLY